MPGRKNHHPPTAWETHPVQPARRGNLLSPAGDLPGPHHQRRPYSPSRKPSCCDKCSPPSKKQHDKHEKDSQSLSLKCKDKPCSDRRGKDKEGDKSPQKHPMSPPQQPPSAERARKEPCLEETSLTISVNSKGHH